MSFTMVKNLTQKLKKDKVEDIKDSHKKCNHKDNSRLREKGLEVQVYEGSCVTKSESLKVFKIVKIRE